MSLEELYNSTFDCIYKFLYYKSVNNDQIEDLVHDIYIRYSKSYGEKNFGLEEAKKILYGISRNVYKEWVREAIKLGKVDFVDNYASEDDTEPLENLDMDNNKELLKKAIARLPDNLKYIIESRFLNNMTRAQIAASLNIKEKDVHTYQKRAIKYLKKFVGELT